MGGREEWVAEKIIRDHKINELKTALETTKEQQATTEQAWKIAVEKIRSLLRERKI